MLKVKHFYSSVSESKFTGAFVVAACPPCEFPFRGAAAAAVALTSSSVKEFRRENSKLSSSLQQQGGQGGNVFASPSSSVPLQAAPNRRGSGINLKNLDDLGPPRLLTAARKVLIHILHFIAML